jgi:hypothetical protein
VSEFVKPGPDVMRFGVFSAISGGPATLIDFCEWGGQAKEAAEEHVRKYGLEEGETVYVVQVLYQTKDGQ